MDSPFDDPRVRPLLVEADRLLAALSIYEATERVGIMETLDTVHRDVGRALHDLWIEQQHARRGRAAEEVTEVVEIESFEPLPSASDGTDWLDALQDTLALLGDPPTEPAPLRLATEASAVQWASAAARDQWVRFPDPIQQALLGLLVARCRFLIQELPIDSGPRRAIERIDAFRRAQGLSAVLGLNADDNPESGSWTSDAIHWWEMLVGALEQRS